MTFGFSFKVLFYFLQHEVKGQVDSEEARPKMINSVLSVYILTLFCSIQKFISCMQHSRAWWEDDSVSTLFWGLTRPRPARGRGPARSGGASRKVFFQWILFASIPNLQTVLVGLLSALGNLR